MFIGHCNWAMIILNGMLYEMLMLFQGKRLVIVCSKQFRILIKMQSNFATFLCAFSKIVLPFPLHILLLLNLWRSM